MHSQPVAECAAQIGLSVLAGPDSTCVQYIYSILPAIRWAYRRSACSCARTTNLMKVLAL